MATFIRRILVRVDFGPTSQVALSLAKRLAARLGARLHLLHVIEDPAASDAWASEPFMVEVPRRFAAMRADAEFRLGIVLTRAERTALGAAVEVVAGSPAREIVAYAGNNDIDLIVMGTHGRCGFAHATLGSVAEQTIRRAPCPVLTVRRAKASVDTLETASDAKAWSLSVA